MLALLSVWSMRCAWPSGFHCHSLSLAPVKSRLVLPFLYRFTRYKRPHAFQGGPLNFGPKPPWAAHSKKVFPQFFKNLRGGVQVFVCAIRGPQRPVRDKILATVSWPFFAGKKSEILTKIDDFSSYEEVAKPKNIWAMRAYAAHK